MSALRAFFNGEPVLVHALTDVAISFRPFGPNAVAFDC
jgi:hypothetical protein